MFSKEKYKIEINKFLQISLELAFFLPQYAYVYVYRYGCYDPVPSIGSKYRVVQTFVVIILINVNEPYLNVML